MACTKNTAITGFWYVKEVLMIKYSSVYQFSLLQLLKFNWIIWLGAMWRCLVNEKSRFAIVVARCKISYRIYNKITRHSVISSTCVPSICLHLPTLFLESLGFLRGRDTFLHIKKPVCPGNEVVHLVTAWKLNYLLTSFMLNKKVKNRWIKKTKKNKEKVRSSLKLPSIYPFSESLHHCPIHGERQRSESHRNGVPWSF